MTRPLHFLVTDDDLDKRLLLSRALARQFPHASIFECHSGKEALEYFAANRVDAIVTNHNMKLVMVSAHDELKDEALAAGVDRFVTTEDMANIGKPIAEFFRSRGLQDAKEAGAK